MRADAAESYKRIVRAAVAAFEETGPEATLEEIAERANVNVATVYRRFGSRDQLLRATFGYLFATEIEPMTTTQTGDPWRDLVGAMETAVELMARRPAIPALAAQFPTFAAESSNRFLSSVRPLLQRAIDAGVVRPELEVRDLGAIIALATVPVYPSDFPDADRRRYFALLTDGMRPAPIPLPPPSSHEVPGAYPDTISRQRGD